MDSSCEVRGNGGHLKDSLKRYWRGAGQGALRITASNQLGFDHHQEEHDHG